MKKFISACLMGSLVFMLGLAGAVSCEYGSKVALGDTDVGDLLYNVAPTFGYWDLGAPGYDQGDVVYMHLGSGATISPNDIRITPFGTLDAGTKVNSSDNDINKPLSAFIGGTAIMFTNLYGGPGYDFKDPVYLHIGGTTGSTSTNDIRLNKVDGPGAGSKVLDYDGDHNKPLSPLNFYTIRFFNANGNYDLTGTPIYDSEDRVYLDFSLPSTSTIGFVAVNDVRLSA